MTHIHITYDQIIHHIVYPSISVTKDISLASHFLQAILEDTPMKPCFQWCQMRDSWKKSSLQQKKIPRRKTSALPWSEHQTLLAACRPGADAGSRHVPVVETAGQGLTSKRKTLVVKIPRETSLWTVLFTWLCSSWVSAKSHHTGEWRRKCYSVFQLGKSSRFDLSLDGSLSHHAVFPYHDFSSIRFLLESGMCFYQTVK